MKLFNSCILIFEILERNRTATRKQNNSIKRQTVTKGTKVQADREHDNTCISSSSCFFFSASTAMLNNLASLNNETKKKQKNEIGTLLVTLTPSWIRFSQARVHHSLTCM